MICILTSDQISSQFVPIFKDLYEQRHEDCLQNLAQFSGCILHGFKERGVHDEELTI